MYFFRRKIIPFQDIFPKGFFDIHSHILFGIDDGAKTIDDSMALIEQFSKMGITNFVTTPHILGELWPNTPELINQQLDAVRTALHKREFFSTIHAAAEYMLDERFMQLLETEELLTIGDQFILVELPFFNAPENLMEIIFKIQTKGYKPILAHPERYFYYHDKLTNLLRLREVGCFFQLNLLSLTKHYGIDVYKVAVYLLKNNAIDFLGTDAHHLNHLHKLQKLGTRKNVKLLEKYIECNQELMPFKKTLF